MHNSTENHTSCGYVALLGRPNVGKSTLLNKIIAHKISITARKAQTTRHKILGIKTAGSTQIIYVDTPGIHSDGKRAINRYMNQAALSVIHDVDVIVFMIDAKGWTDADRDVLTKISEAGRPVILVVNKVDKVPAKEELLPRLAELATKMQFAAIVPLSAKTGSNVAALEDAIAKLLPAGVFLFPAEQITDRDQKFRVSEIIREKLIRSLGQELPYATAVSIEQFATDEKGLLRVSAVIFVERESQKAIVVGKGGEMLKKIGTEARKELEYLLETKVFLQLWVKVKSRWSDDEKSLKSLGYV